MEGFSTPIRGALREESGCQDAAGHRARACAIGGRCNPHDQCYLAWGASGRPAQSPIRRLSVDLLVELSVRGSLPESRSAS